MSTLTQEIIDEMNAFAKGIEARVGGKVNIYWRCSDKTSQIMQLADIISAVCDVQWERIISPDRHHDIVIARQLFYVFARRRYKQTLVQIAKLLNRDHTTVIYGIESIDSLLWSKDRLVTMYYHTIENILNGKGENKTEQATMGTAVTVIEECDAANTD
jgi:hypothetical protein